MNETPAEGNVHAKTGYIDFVVSLSGYVTTKDGEHLAFVMIANNLNTSKYAVQSAMDSICVRLAEFSRHSQPR